MRLFALGLICLTATLLPFTARGDDSPLLKGGKLTARLEVTELQSGVAGITGTYFTVEPDGSWVSGPIETLKEKKGKPDAKGKLSAEQLSTLADALSKHDVATLPNHGVVEVNPQVFRVRFGTRTAELQPGRGKATESQDRKVRERYAGIVDAVQAACQAKKE